MDRNSERKNEDVNDFMVNHSADAWEADVVTPSSTRQSRHHPHGRTLSCCCDAREDGERHRRSIVAAESKFLRNGVGIWRREPPSGHFDVTKYKLFVSIQ